jgi:hypothetical protein
MREKAKTDVDFRNRLIDFIRQETIPEKAVDEVNPELGYRVFQPLFHPDDPNFEDKMKVDIYDIVHARNMHKHTASCYKYGHKTCRARFPRRLVHEMIFNEDTGIVEMKRDNPFNGFNSIFAVTDRANHDAQVLTTKEYALSIMYYINKYISKVEMPTHSKLTIAAAVRFSNKTLWTKSTSAKKYFTNHTTS